MDERVQLNPQRHNNLRRPAPLSVAPLLIHSVVLPLDLDKGRVFSNMLLTKRAMILVRCLVQVLLFREVVLVLRSIVFLVSKLVCLLRPNTRINKHSVDILSMVD